jgi:PAS domain S-box-containing protein
LGQSLYELLGYSPKTKLADHWESLVHPEDWPTVRAAIDKAIKPDGGRYEIEYRMLHANGHWCTVFARGRVVERDSKGQPLFTFGVTADITEEQKIRLALRNERIRLRTILDTLPDPVWLKNLLGEYQMCNPAFEKLLGRKENEIIGHTNYDFFDTPEAQSLIQSDHHALVSKEPLHLNLWQNVNHQSRFLHITKTAVRDGLGQIVGVLGIAHDETDDQLNNEALKASEQRYRELAHTLRLYRQVFDETADGILITNPEGTIEFINDAYIDMTGFDKSYVLGKKPNLFKSGRHDAVFYKAKYGIDIKMDGFIPNQLRLAVCVMNTGLLRIMSVFRVIFPH